MMSAEKKATLPAIIPFCNLAYDVLETFSPQTDDPNAKVALEAAVGAGRLKLQSYYSKMHGDIITSATILDPRCKLEYHSDNDWSDNKINEAKRKLQRLYEQYVLRSPPCQETRVNNVSIAGIDPYKRKTKSPMSELDR